METQEQGWPVQGCAPVGPTWPGMRCCVAAPRSRVGGNAPHILPDKTQARQQHPKRSSHCTLPFSSGLFLPGPATPLSGRPHLSSVALFSAAPLILGETGLWGTFFNSCSSDRAAPPPLHGPQPQTIRPQVPHSSLTGHSEMCFPCRPQLPPDPMLSCPHRHHPLSPSPSPQCPCPCTVCLC